jgi:hypothetical protein
VSFEIIIPFLKPIEHLFANRTVSEIMINPDGSVWIEEMGHIELLSDIRFEDGALLTTLEVIANRFGKKLDADSPIQACGGRLNVHHITIGKYIPAPYFLAGLWMSWTRQRIADSRLCGFFPFRFVEIENSGAAFESEQED